MTIKDIARECGYGVGTVSRVLNDHPDVSEQTREKVLAVVRKHGFALNQNAKLLKKQDSKNLVILVKGSSSFLLNSLLEIIQRRLEPLPYTADVVVLEEDDNEAQAASRIYYERKPLGMIFLGGCPGDKREDFAKVPIPSVVISNKAEGVESSRLSSVSIDDTAAAAYSAEYLIRNGHTKIGVVGGDFATSDMSRSRFGGFMRAMEAHGLDFDFETQYAVARYTFAGGAAAVRSLRQSCPGMTAVFTMADVMAMGAVRQLHDEGLSVPGDVSVIGFDGLPMADYYCPRLTTIRQPVAELAEGGLETLLRSVERKAPCTHTLVPFEFVPGESVRPLRGGA